MKRLAFLFLIFLFSGGGFDAVAQLPQGVQPRKPYGDFHHHPAVSGLPIFDEVTFTPTGEAALPRQGSLAQQPLMVADGQTLPFANGGYTVEQLVLKRTRFGADKTVVGYHGWVVLRGTFVTGDGNAMPIRTPLVAVEVDLLRLYPKPTDQFVSFRVSRLPGVLGADALYPVVAILECRDGAFRALPVQSAVPMPPHLLPVKQ